MVVRSIHRASGTENPILIQILVHIEERHYIAFITASSSVHSSLTLTDLHIQKLNFDILAHSKLEL